MVIIIRVLTQANRKDTRISSLLGKSVSDVQIFRQLFLNNTASAKCDAEENLAFRKDVT